MSAPADSIPIPEVRFSQVHVDLVGPLPSSSHGHNYLMTMVDRATRWPEVVPLKDTSAETVVDTFVSAWVSRFGVPQVVISDRGSQFTSGVWDCMCQKLGVEHHRTTAYHPQSNGLVERFHRQLKDALRARSSGGEWLEHLPFVLLGLRSAPKEMANISSAESAYGMPLALPGGAALQCPPTRDSPPEPPVIPSTAKRTYAEAAASPPAPLVGARFAYIKEGHPGGPFRDKFRGPFRIVELRAKIALLELGDKLD